MRGRREGETEREVEVYRDRDPERAHKRERERERERENESAYKTKETHETGCTSLRDPLIGMCHLQINCNH